MARKPRCALPDIPLHVIQRGNNREPCFFVDEDYVRYLRDLRHSVDKYACSIHAYVLMTNHVHLLTTSSESGGISKMMQALGRRYVGYVNRRHDRTGTLWEGRFKSAPIDSEAYLLTCMRYIELNPVRAGIAAHPGEYPWSSYAANAEGHPDPVVSAHPLYTQLHASAARRQHAYRELFRDQIDEDLLADLRQSVNRDRVLGRLCFRRELGL